MKLHGLAVSNYYNIVKLALLEKHLAFEEVHAPPSSSADFLACSPMGRIPFLQHGDFYLSESQAILFYLELYQPSPRLYPKEPQLAGLAQQIHQMIDLYLDPPARSVMAAAFFGADVDAEKIAAASVLLKKNVSALSRIVRFAPYIAGADLSHADLAAFMTFGFVQTVMERLHGSDPLAKLPGVGAYMEMMAERASCRQVLADQQRALQQLASG